MKIQKLIVVALAALLVAGCASRNVPTPDAENGSMIDDGSDFADTDGMDDGGLGDGEDFNDMDDMGELTMIIYFDFDQSELRAEYSDLLQRHAGRLSNDRRAQIRLEGHADERGSREYNIGLGERRSQSVRRLLLIQGATADQISTVSFGEERPAAFGSDEAAYQQNRRVEISYVN
ncbi:MAG: peptidoglycan-associated lipoprotein Pal [Proteobacteria bacterium]|nr:peptidoglycan-associated lipoprotein Pal [Pseudomonadota bacterium]MDA0993479.1 peptidoglycan-associated lipoprotein Pal [Pseudomonadota bacterium]